MAVPHWVADNCRPKTYTPRVTDPLDATGRYGCGSTSSPVVCTGVPSALIMILVRTRPSAMSCPKRGEILMPTLLAGDIASIKVGASAGPSWTHGETARKTLALLSTLNLRSGPKKP